MVDQAIGSETQGHQTSSARRWFRSRDSHRALALIQRRYSSSHPESARCERKTHLQPWQTDRQSASMTKTALATSACFAEILSPGFRAFLQPERGKSALL